MHFLMDPTVPFADRLKMAGVKNDLKRTFRVIKTKDIPYYKGWQVDYKDDAVALISQPTPKETTNAGK